MELPETGTQITINVTKEDIATSRDENTSCMIERAVKRALPEVALVSWGYTTGSVYLDKPKVKKPATHFYLDVEKGKIDHVRESVMMWDRAQWDSSSSTDNIKPFRFKATVTDIVIQ